MKKVKIMLASIAVMAIVAGALAFKTKKTETCLFTSTTLNAPAGIKTCTKTSLDFWVDQPNPLTYYYTTYTEGDIKCETTTNLCTETQRFAIEP